jgi:acyl-CoA thioesterase
VFSCCVLLIQAYMSDWGLFTPACRPHGILSIDHKVIKKMVSLDHALWFAPLKHPGRA